MTVEELAGLGKVTKEVEPFKGLKVKMHSLTAREEEEIFAAMSVLPDDPLVRTTSLQVETLARTIESIGSKTYTDVKELKAYLKGLQRQVLVTLWETWMKEVENDAEKDVQDLKKDSETQKAG